MKTVFDIGMHLGEDTAYYLARGFRVVAVEANPELVSYCREKFATELTAGVLEIVHGAITDGSPGDEVTFYKNSKLSEWGTINNVWAERNERLGAGSQQIQVPVVDLLELFASFGCPHYIKIDIEGMDLTCLSRLLESDCRPNFVSIESEKKDFSTLVREFDVFEALGYSKFFVKQQANVRDDTVPPDSVEGNYLDYRFMEEASGLFGSDLGKHWLTRKEALKVYKKVFILYKIFGDDSLLRRVPLGGRLIRGLARLLRAPLPGWYDTHAAFH